MEATHNTARLRPAELFWCWLGVAFALGVCTTVRAQQIELAWTAPSECPQQSAVRARVDSMLAASHADQRSLVARGVVRKQGDGAYRLALEVDVDGHHATRTLSARDCSSLTDTGAWLMAVAIDPEIPPPPPPPEPALTPKPAEPPAQPPAASELPKPNPPPAAPETKPKEPEKKPEPEPEAGKAEAQATPRAPRAPLARWWRVGAYGGVWSASLPAAQGQLGLRGGIGFGWLYTELRADHVFARSQALASAGGLATFSTQQLTAALCGEWGGRLRAGPCLTLGAARTTGETTGVTNPGTDAVFWALGGASLGLFVRLFSWVELSAEAGAGLPLSPRPRFSVQPLGSVGEASLVTGYARLGLGIRSR